MSAPNDYPTPEAPTASFQRFEGEIIDEFTQVGHNTVHTPMLRTEMGLGDKLVVAPDAESARLGSIEGLPVVAKIELGGVDNIPATQILAARYDPGNEDKRLRSLLAGAEQTGAFDPTKRSFVLFDANDMTIRGFTFVKESTGNGLFGRFQSNMSWFNAAGKPYPRGVETVVIPNESVSRTQLKLAHDKKTGGLIIEGRSEHSPSVVTTVATAEHKDIVDKNAAKSKAAEEAAARASQKTTARDRISKLIRGRV